MSNKDRSDEEQEERDELAGALREMPKLPRTAPLIDRVREVVTSRGASRVNGLLLDLFTANAIIKVHDALNDDNKAKFAALPLRRMATVAFKLIGPAK